MSTTPTPNPPADPGLPPVEPPSAQLMIRLFLVPGLIVAGLVLLFLAGPWLYGVLMTAMGSAPADARSAAEFLRQIDSPNPDIRYRAASDLAQVLLRKVELASDPGFALDLADRLQDALSRSAEAEKTFAAKSDGLTTGERLREIKALEPDRNLVIYLAAALGNCVVPAGAPLLRGMAEQEGGMEPVALSERRGRALFALATLGENVKRFDALEEPKREAIMEKLSLEPVRTKGRGPRAAACLAYLSARDAGEPATLGVPATLRKCADDDDPFLREMAGFAATFWTGPAAEEAALEAMLTALVRDDGRGEEKLDERRERDPNTASTREVTTKRGFTVRANATIALARKGSARTDLDALATLLSPDELRGVFVLRSKDGTDRPNEALVVVTVAGALKASAVLAKQRPEARGRLEPLVKALAGDRNAALAAEAREALHAFK
jgi:hypothetical protein